MGVLFPIFLIILKLSQITIKGGRSGKETFTGFYKVVPPLVLHVNKNN